MDRENHGNNDVILSEALKREAEEPALSLSKEAAFHSFEETI